MEAPGPAGPMTNSTQSRTSPLRRKGRTPDDARTSPRSIRATLGDRKTLHPHQRNLRHRPTARRRGPAVTARAGRLGALLRSAAATSTPAAAALALRALGRDLLRLRCHRALQKLEADLVLGGLIAGVAFAPLFPDHHDSHMAAVLEFAE